MTAAPGGVLALDLSLSTGYAHGGINDANPTSGWWKLPPSDDLGRCYAALANEVEDACAVLQPRFVYVEAPIPEIRQTSAVLLLGLAATVAQSCHRMEVPCVPVHVSTARAAVMGSGRFATGTAKAEVAAWCARIGWVDHTDDELDARILWLYAVMQLRPRARRRAGG